MKKPMTRAERAEYRKAKMAEAEEYQKKLVDGLTALRGSDEYAKFLSAMARFPKYSIKNVMMICQQKEDASLVASFSAWKKLGRHVVKGEKGIRIWAPITRNAKDEDEDDEQRVRGFRLVSVFDISQTDGEPLPELARDLDGDVTNFDETWHALVSGTCVTVRYGDVTEGANGQCNTQTGEIKIREGMSPAQTMKTLIHEIAHCILHAPGNALTRGMREMQAESVAYIVSQHIGLDTSEYSFGYVDGWSEGMTPEQIMDITTPILKTAANLIGYIDQATAAAA